MDLITFTKEILYGKLHVFCSDRDLRYGRVKFYHLNPDTKLVPRTKSLSLREVQTPSIRLPTPKLESPMILWRQYSLSK